MAQEDQALATVAAEPEIVPPVRQRRHEKIAAWQDDITRSHEGEEDTAWLITYLDMLTLLLTLLVVMLSYSTFKPDKFTEAKDPAKTAVSKDAGMAPPKPAEARPDPARQLAERLAGQLGKSGLQDMVRMEIEDSRLTLQIQEQILFPSGGADLNLQGSQVLERLAPMFMAPGQMISVEGHTDNVPIKTGMFPSNWELSSLRATRVLRFLAERGVPPNRLRAIGYGEMRPLASNDSEQGRSANRRVAIVIDLAVAMAGIGN